MITKTCTIIRTPIEARNYGQNLLMVTAYWGQVKFEKRNVKERSLVQNVMKLY